MRHYLLVVWGDAELSLRGPYGTAAERDAEARAHREREGPEDGLHWLDQNEDGTLEAGDYPGAFFMDGDEDDEPN